MKLLLTALFLMAGQAWAYCENFSSYSAGTDMSAEPNWYKAGSGTLTADNSATFGSMALKHTASGGWLQSEYRGGWGDTDYSVRLSNPYYVTVRQQNLTGIFTPAYYVRFDNATTLAYGKICGGNNFDAGTAAISVSLTDVTLRITMVGYVMNAYVNGSLAVTHDFTGNVFCSSAAYPTGGIGLQFINATTYADNIVVNDVCLSAPNVPITPYQWQRLKPGITPRWPPWSMLRWLLLPGQAQAGIQDWKVDHQRIKIAVSREREAALRQDVLAGRATLTATPTPLRQRAGSPTPSATTTATPTTTRAR